MYSRQFLFEKYGGFADKRCKQKERDYSIAVHESRVGDIDGQCCAIFVNVPVDDLSKVTLTLSNAPFDNEIKEWATKHAATFTQFDDRARISISLDVRNVQAIKSLAGKINQIPNRGRKVWTLRRTRNYRWLCERTARALRTLAANLEELLKNGITTTPVPTVTNNPKPKVARTPAATPVDSESFDLTDPLHWERPSI